eukprot:2873903-Pyramimonas_sp.AAC.1
MHVNDGLAHLELHPAAADVGDASPPYKSGGRGKTSIYHPATPLYPCPEIKRRQCQRDLKLPPSPTPLASEARSGAPAHP